MDTTIRIVDLAELADTAARHAVQTHEDQPNPFEPETMEAGEWQRRYQIALLRHGAPHDAEGTA